MAEEIKKRMSNEEAWGISARMRSTVKIRNAMEFADMNITPPDIDFHQDYDQYYNPHTDSIHIGTYGIVDLFDVESEADFYEAFEYIRGHESEHRRCTASRPYAVGIQKGCEAVLRYIASKVEKTAKRFKKPADYKTYAENTLPSMGIYISWEMVENIVAGIANSLEDGRIERIRASRNPGYERLRTKYRAIFWQKQEVEMEDYDKIADNPAKKLHIICTNLLTLSTCQLYTKGFALKYAGTPLMDEVNSLMPYIAKGYIASKCRDMSMQVEKISEMLAPYIYETCRMSEADVKMREMLEQLLADLISASIENNIMNPGGELSEKDEMADEMNSLPNNAFPVSDLVITLPDDVYDKLEEQNRLSNDEKKSGLQVRREHPKEEKQEGQEKRQDGGNGNGADTEENSKENAEKNAEKTSGGSAGKGDSEQEAEKEGAGMSQSTAGTDKEAAEMQSPSIGDGSEEDASEDNAGCGAAGGNSDPGQQESAGSQSSEDGTMAGSEEFEDGSEGGGHRYSAEEILSGNQNGNGSRDNEKGKEDMHGSKDIADAVLQAAKEAAEQTHEEAKIAVSNINATIAHVAKEKSRYKGTPDTTPLVPKEVGKKFGCNFNEYKRQYKVKDRLPAVLNARGRAMFRKNKRYFKSLSTPNVTNLDSGQIDPSLIYGLSFGKSEVFRKKGKDKVFDGCAYVLMDNSGSMHGNKRIEAAKAGAIIEEGFRGMFPIKIVAFDHTGTINHEIVKNWDEWLPENCCWNYALHGRGGVGNEDGYDIDIATYELLQRHERKKMLLVLSDGAPGDKAHVRRAVEKARKKGIEVYSIYFEEGHVGDISTFAYMYQKDYIACELSELDKNMEKLFKKFSRS